MSLKNALHKAAGLFVDIPEAVPTYSANVEEFTATPPAPRTVEQVVQQAPGPNLDQIQVPAEVVKQPLLMGDGTPDFGAIYSQAGVPQAVFGADEAHQVIGSLPVELPLDVKRKTVGATLTAMGKAMGVTTDTVVADASRKIAALSSFAEQLAGQTHQYQQSVEQKIVDLKSQIADCEGKVSETNAKLAKVQLLCETEGARLDDVLEFFTLDVAPSKHA